MKKMKKFAVLSLATALLVTPLTSVSFADSSKIVSDEGIGIEVYNPFMQDGEFSMFKQSPRKDIEGNKVSVAGGTLWATWRDGTSFRANYDHNSKEHRSTARNDTGYQLRSSWVGKRSRAISPWVSQTLFGNRVFGATK
ncbi:hypothetical protein UT300013_33650 [Paraclostridium sordellii]